MKPTKEKEYNWSYSRTNSKGEVIFRHDTEEDFNFVTAFLDKKNIEYEKKMGGSMMWIYYKDETYSYYPTTGRWQTRRNHFLGHYHSKGIEDFYTRFLIPKQEFTLEETIESVEKILDKNEIDFVRKDNVVLLTTKLVPRKDGKGNRKQYAYSYTIGTGRWKPIREDKEGMYKDVEYKSGGIEWFLKKHFLDLRTNPTFT